MCQQLVVEHTSALATGVGGNNAQWTSSLIHSSITTRKTPFSPHIMLWHRKSIFQIPFKMPIVIVISILLFHLLNSSIPCRNMFHASYLSRQILWARSVSFPALMNIRSTLTTRQRHWQNPTHSADLTCVVMRHVQIKTTCDMTRITPDSSIFSLFPLPTRKKWTSGSGTVPDSGQRHKFFSQLAASLKDQYKAGVVSVASLREQYKADI